MELRQRPQGVIFINMIEKNFKRKFALRFSGIVLVGISVIVLSFYLALPKSEVRHYTEAIYSFIKADYTLSRVTTIALIVESILISAAVILTAVFASHKIAGPVYRLKMSLNELAATLRTRPVGFRSYDQIHGTASSFNAMLNELNGYLRAASNAYEEFEEIRKKLDDTSESREKLKEKVDNLGKSIKRFNF